MVLTFKRLLQKVGYPETGLEPFLDFQISGLSSDSRYAKKGDLFFARKGEKGHGLDYLADLEQKEVALIAYEMTEGLVPPKNIPSFALPLMHKWLPLFSTSFYAESLNALSLIGVTGTEGKTSVTQFIAQIFSQLSIQCGLVGTNGIGFLGALHENTHTTPDLIALQDSLAQIERQLKAEIKPVALEVTSHALEQKRVENLQFAVTVLTNLTRDHLDYHGTLEAYRQAKSRLFLDYSSVASILNYDDSLGRSLFDLLTQKGDRELYPYGEAECKHPNYLQITELHLHHDGLTFNLIFKGQSYSITSPLYGRFNASNLTAAMASLLALGFPIEKLVTVIANITNVTGRMGRVVLDKGAIGIVDYAHKPNALLQALTSLREHLKSGRLICVFGCGGDRDKGKRPLMASIAEEHADLVIVTSDNPRFEDPSMIINDIMAGFLHPNSEAIITVQDRGQAIYKALEIAQSGDIVLIAGKGHEDYQIIGDRTIYFSDIDEIYKFNKEE